MNRSLVNGILAGCILGGTLATVTPAIAAIWMETKESAILFPQGVYPIGGYVMFDEDIIEAGQVEQFLDEVESSTGIVWRAYTNDWRLLVSDNNEFDNADWRESGNRMLASKGLRGED